MHLTLQRNAIVLSEITHFSFELKLFSHFLVHQRLKAKSKLQKITAQYDLKILCL